jgi:phosphinothricin acetyltransferase
MLIRECALSDLQSVADIYAHHVRAGAGSFEEEPPDLAAMTQRWRAIAARGLPWLVAEADGAVRGYCYAGPFRERSAFRFTVEDAVYVAPDAVGQGVGRALLAELLVRCAAGGYREMIAVIGDSANEASIRLHASLGFRPAGALRDVGFKFGRWLDCVFMQRSLQDRS